LVLILPIGVLLNFSATAKHIELTSAHRTAKPISRDEKFENRSRTITWI